MTIEEKKQNAETWFRELRDSICNEFEKIETEYAASYTLRSALRREPLAAEGQRSEGNEEFPSIKTFTFTPWQRQEGGTGEIGIMKGRVFEKVGVNISTVHGEFSEAFRKEIPGAQEDPRFWATGISLVAHMCSPKVPAAHFNTRMITTGNGTRLWFGGGGDLNPMVENPEDTADFHRAFQHVCDEADQWNVAALSCVAPKLREPLAAGVSDSEGGKAPFKRKTFYEAFKGWCDEYFFIPHRNEARGVGGIFYDYLGLNQLGEANAPIAPGQFGKGGVGKEKTAIGMEIAANALLSWDEAFAFTQKVGVAFRDTYAMLVRHHMHTPWTDDEREHQLRKRGRYAEYNLLYDRGTRFGLMTGGNPDAILMSLPPIAKWD